MDPKIIPHVEYSPSDLPDGFSRPTNRVSLRIEDEGLTWNGELLKWQEIQEVQIKFCNGNPYVQMKNSSTSRPNVSFFFPSKWYKRHIKPWFGASSNITLEFLDIIIENTEVITREPLEKEILENNANPVIQRLWNIFFFIFPLFLIVFSIIIIIAGITAGG